MISIEELSRCMEILSQLNASTYIRRDKQLILELGYIIKQEFDLARKLDNVARNRNGRNIDVNKLMEDNRQLFQENEKLINDINKLKDILYEKIPSIQEDIQKIGSKFDLLNQQIGHI